MLSSSLPPCHHHPFTLAPSLWLVAHIVTFGPEVDTDVKGMTPHQQYIVMDLSDQGVRYDVYHVKSTGSEEREPAKAQFDDAQVSLGFPGTKDNSRKARLKRNGEQKYGLKRKGESKVFQAEYIDRYSDDELSDKVKGTVVWKEHEGVEGYFLFHPNTQKYRQVHYLEDLRQWAYIDYSTKKGQWYTISIVPQALGVGPLTTKTTSGIAIDDDAPS
ncbi:hypothetical protein EDB86DRAFT_3081963 [Lactarius hatsudake]|nr:hypothetical protein EDB86DRAFT_3081963 [Lactarius hatsudake]